jgi:predicted PurR-regulated permease PerM
VLSIFVYASVRLIEPFLAVFLWSVVIAVALAPVYEWLKRSLGGRGRLAAGLVTIVALSVVLGPVAALAGNFVESLGKLIQAFNHGHLSIPLPSTAVADLPIVGPRLHEFWTLASTNIEDAVRRAGPTLLPAGEAILGILADVSLDLVSFLAAVLLSGFLYVPGHKLAERGKQLAGRIIAPRGAQFVDMAGATIRNVSRGVVGVAALQMVLAGVVMQIAGVPASGLAAFSILMLAIMQIGALPVVLPVLIWAWFQMPIEWTVFLTVTLIPIGLIDNILKPLLMSRGLTTPTLVIFVGVIGGTISYGLIGLFLGPIVLSVFYDLILAWTGNAPEWAGNDITADPPT